MSKAVIFFAPGLEECEGLLCVDILRRAGVEVTIAAVGGEKIVRSARQISVVADALRRSGTDGPAVMVGDRRFDVAGAHENGLPAIGVLYGYGGREELENAGADYLAADLHELKQLLLQE